MIRWSCWPWLIRFGKNFLVTLSIYVLLSMPVVAAAQKTVNSVPNRRTIKRVRRPMVFCRKTKSSLQHAKPKLLGQHGLILLQLDETSTIPRIDEIVHLIRRIRQEVGIEVCCSLGFLTPEQAKRLHDAGLSRLHCNIETAPSYFDQVCTTHTIEEKVQNVATAQAAGIRVCCGGIIGLGETLDQRVEMAFQLKKMGIDAIPLNVLNPVPGTPFEHNARLSPMEILRSFAMFRFVLPKAQIRTAGGRQVNLRSLQSLALAGGMNGVMIGNYLTTKGTDPADDITMLHDLGRVQTRPQV